MPEPRMEMETRARRRFDVWNEVPLVPQLTGMSCWAAAAAMIIGWRDRILVDPPQVARGAGSWQSYAGGLRPGDVQSLARAWGLVEEHRETWTPEALRRVLQRHGPVWLGEASPGLHSVVVAGMHGDGTADGTWVRVNDPWPIGRGERYTLPWRTLSANYRAASDLIGVQAHVLHAGGRRGSARSRVAETRATRSGITLPPFPAPEEPMNSNGNGRRPHPEEYASAYGTSYGSPLAVAAAAVAAGERYVSTGAGGGTNPLASHGGTGENLYLAWNAMSGDAAQIDLVVHLHGFTGRNPDAACTRFLAGRSGLRLDGRARPTLAILPRGRKITAAEVEAKQPAYQQKLREYEALLAEYNAHPAGRRPPRRPSPPRDDVYTFPALEHGSGAGLEALVAWAVAWFAREVLQRGERPGIGRCILAGHSGGGAPVNALLQWKDQRAICNPHEVHLFDALYGGTGNIVAWAGARVAADRRLAAGLSPADALARLRAQGGGLRIFYRGEGTMPNSQAVGATLPAAGDPLQGAYRAEQTTFPHEDVPRAFQPALLGDVRATLPLDPAARPPASRAHSADGYGEYSAEEDTAMEPAYGYPGAGPYYGYVAALAVDDDVRAWLAARAPTDRAPLAAGVAAWITDTARSGIDLIGDATRRAHFLTGVDWTRVDFPGNDADRSAEATALFAAIAAAVPERRVTALRYHDVDAVVQPVPGASGFRLHPEAKDAFVRMRDAARTDGVELRIGSAWRSLQHQARLAAGNPNPNAVAQRVSAHSYGLAVDLLLSADGLRVSEITTRPFTNVVAMYRSPVYKWMALHARDHGFFPYRREPWHWEYNPAGFGERFEREAPAAAHGHAYGAPFGLFERYPGGALDAAPVNRIAVPRIARPSLGEGMQAPAPVDWCAMRTTIANVALAEERRWTRPNGTKLVESDASQLAILQQYWQSVPGFAAPAAALAAARRSANNERFWEWSAAFICHVMHTAGVQRAHGFEFAGRHMNYIVGALRNRERSDTTRPFWLVDHLELAHETTLEPGDLLCLNRPVEHVWTNHTYTSLRRAFWENGHQNADVTGSSHVALIVRTGQDARGRFVETIGGNETQSVRLRRVDLDANGGIANAQARHIFGLIKMTGCNR
ncbi:DUF2272 domain-containing protein [Longimicrobium sp.]|uniref:DUF2272 domain-containing protein n=1 Tax=Longimicrobium sp. TaxID=2029185 RepID=UPI002C6EE487|nr:DUF2272 domain-containing protein [Longimicrobium sp.]HSU14311.1 DUF2272 domain-containing protein [Longimicrobium sp.]